MPPIKAGIAGFVAGNDLQIIRTPIANIPTGLTLAKAYFTVKNVATDADPGLLQLAITPTISTAGQITDIGAGTGSLPVGSGALTFTLTKAQTLALGPGKAFAYDILLIFNDGSDATYEVGNPQIGGGLIFLQGVTQATT